MAAAKAGPSSGNVVSQVAARAAKKALVSSFSMSAMLEPRINCTHADKVATPRGCWARPARPSSWRSPWVPPGTHYSGLVIDPSTSPRPTRWKVTAVGDGRVTLKGGVDTGAPRVTAA